MENKLSKSEYAKMMSERRKNLFAMANSTREDIIKNPAKFRSFLRIHAVTGYSITNTLLIVAQKQDATILKDSSRWQESKTFIKKGEKGIQILEPKGEYTKKDGSKGTSYSVKHVFDVSQTSKADDYAPPYYMEKTMIHALTSNRDITVKPVSDSSSLPRPTYYNVKDNTIYVMDNQKQDILVTGLMLEYSYALIANEFLEDKDEQFIASCLQFMLASKYGYECDKNFSARCSEYFSAPGRNPINELSNICSLFKKIDGPITEDIRRQRKRETVR